MERRARLSVRRKSDVRPEPGGRGRSDGLPTRNAVHGDVAIDEDDLKLKDLVLIEAEPVFEGFELADGAFGSRVF